MTKTKATNLDFQEAILLHKKILFWLVFLLAGSLIFTMIAWRKIEKLENRVSVISHFDESNEISDLENQTASLRSDMTTVEKNVQKLQEETGVLPTECSSYLYHSTVSIKKSVDMLEGDIKYLRSRVMHLEHLNSRLIYLESDVNSVESKVRDLEWKLRGF